jgi:hypothetical protein
MTVALIGSGLTLVIWPMTLSAGNFRQLLLLVGVGKVATAYLSVGVVRAFCLIMNGNLPIWGPRLRAIMSVFSAVIWVQLAMALFVQLAVPSPSIAVYLALAGGELISIRRARRDGDGA